MARRTKLTPAIHKAIVKAVAGGVPLERAAALADISEDTVLEWIERGEGRHPTRSVTPYFAQFALDIKKARAQDEARRVERINQAGQGGTVLHEKTTTYPDGRVIREVKHAEPQWTADAWHLERSRPEAWGRKDRVDLTVTMRKAAEKVAAELGITADEVLAEANEILKGL